MKLIDETHKTQHWQHTLYQGAKGFAFGLGVSAVFVAAFKRRYPVHYGQYNPTIKACMWTLPTLGICGFWADDGSAKFSEMMHRSDYLNKVKDERKKRMHEFSLTNRLFIKVSEHRYKVVVATWAASLGWAWSMINKDRILTTAQKAVQARMYAQAVTILLLLSTMALSVHDQHLAQLVPAPKPDWRRILEDRESENM